MQEPLYDNRTSRQIMKDLAYKHLLYDEPESLRLEDWCQAPRRYYFDKEQNPSLSSILPHRIVTKMIEDNGDLSELGLLMSWCLTCEHAVSQNNIKDCFDMILNTPILSKYHKLTIRLYEEFKLLLGCKKIDRVSLQWKDIPEPQLTAISGTSCLSHSLQVCISRYFENVLM